MPRPLTLPVVFARLNATRETILDGVMVSHSTRTRVPGALGTHRNGFGMKQIGSRGAQYSEGKSKVVTDLSHSVMIHSVICSVIL